jgi:CheY-like chemotaxis protein
MPPRPIRLLLVDDDEVDREAVARGFHASGIDCDITIAGNGVEALRILREPVNSSPLARPFLILLDLNMPQMGGLAFLDELRADHDLQGCVVFALTTSTRDADKAEAYRRHVAAYIPKSAVGEDCSELVRLIDCQWRVGELPA